MSYEKGITFLYYLLILYLWFLMVIRVFQKACILFTRVHLPVLQADSVATEASQILICPISRGWKTTLWVVFGFQRKRVSPSSPHNLPQSEYNFAFPLKDRRGRLNQVMLEWQFRGRRKSGAILKSTSKQGQ